MSTRLHDDDNAIRAAMAARNEIARLLARLKTALPALEPLLAAYSTEYGYEQPFRWMYGRSAHLYAFQRTTLSIVDALRSISPDGELSQEFLRIVTCGTTRSCQNTDEWEADSRAIVEAFLHARFFLEMAVKYGRELIAAPSTPPSGWAALLNLYQLTERTAP